MSLVRWNPLSEMESLHSEMNRLFSRMGGSGVYNGGSKQSSQWILPLDISESNEALKITAALPGVNPDDVNIEVNENTLTISAERRMEEKVSDGGYQWIEQQYGSFSRSVTLPTYADAEKIEASYNNGVLELTVPKRESAKPRRIMLQNASAAPRTLEAGAAQTSEDNNS